MTDDLSTPTAPRARTHPRSWLLRIYGAGPVHAIVLLAGFGFAGYLLTVVLGASEPVWLLVWFVGAIVLHDLVLLPLYSALDRVLTRRRAKEGAHGRTARPWINYVRVPAVISGILLLITFPLVLRLSDHAYAKASGLHESPYLSRWLFVTGLLVCASAVAYALRRRRARARAMMRPSAPPERDEAL